MAEMLYIAEVDVKCPGCGVNFRSRQLPVLLDTGYRNSELRQDFKGKIPPMEHYNVVTCPACGKADWSHKFEATDQPPTLSQTQIPAHVQYRNAALLSEREGGNFFNIGFFYLHAAWCADDVNAVSQASQYRKLAADAFRKSFVDISCPAGQRAEIEYLIGELLRRSGDVDAARAYLDQVLPRLSGRFAVMARKLIRLCQSGQTAAIDFEANGG